MVIKDTTLMDPCSNRCQKVDIRIHDGIVQEIQDSITPYEGEDIIQADGLVTAPGLIDTHVHFRDPGYPEKETLHTGALSAAKGGFTSVVCMANTSPVVDNASVLTDILTRTREEAIHIFQTASVSQSLKGQELTPMEQLKAAGACGFTDDGIPLTNASLCFQAMQQAAELDVPISLHEEDPSFIQENGVNHGKVSDQLGIYGSPAIAEESLVARDGLLALRSGADVVIQHVSSKNSVTLIRMYQSMGAHLHAEATPHHFSLTEEEVLSKGSLAKMNPPLRTEQDRKAIIQGLHDGTIDLIATDHAPHSAEEKDVPLTQAPSGVIGLETSLAAGITYLVRPGYLSLLELLRKMTIQPATLYHLPYGKLEAGSPADCVIFDPDEDWIPDTFASRSSNSPFTGRKLTGKVHFTICYGQVVYDDRFPESFMES